MRFCEGETCLACELPWLHENLIDIGVPWYHYIAEKRE